MKRMFMNFALLVALICIIYVPACSLIAERNNPNDPDNLNEYMGYPVADTGQTLCYDSDGLPAITCDENVSGWPRQDGFYENKPNARSFTGPTQHPTYTSDYTTKDDVTGLVWKSCSQGWDGAACANDNADPNTYNWDSAITTCNALNSLNGGAGYAERKTWRLPTVEELSTLTNYGIVNPAIDAGSFPATQASNYWSSSTYVYSDSKAWNVHYVLGGVNPSDKSINYYVRCVADGP